ncbi:MAG: flavin monoamine oxidase family protein [Hydrogenophaga sp.]
MHERPSEPSPMTVERYRIAIVGAGLAGLTASHLLRQHGVHDHLVLEARPRWGGRILTTPVNDAQPQQFDLGPTWFWPSMQPAFGQFLHDLDLPRFAQHEDGLTVLERPGHPPQHLRGYSQAEPSMRLAGSMAALVDRLAADLPPAQLRLGHRVQALEVMEGGVVVMGNDISSIENSPAPEVPPRPLCMADQVLLALPPRLVAHHLRFDPPLPPTLQRAWQATGTWMAPHAKYLAVYERPFWRAQGLSGAARSGRGPMVEVHDASLPDGGAALFGFIGVSAQSRTRVSDATLLALCRAQLVRLFGPQAAALQAEHLKDWAQDPFTATAADLEEPPEHRPAPPAGAPEGAWRSRILGIGSEWSPQFPGYLAGAVDAASRGVQALLGRRL